MLKYDAKKNLDRPHAFSLVELLIVFFIGATVLTMGISLYVTCVATGSKNLKMSRLRSDLLSLVALIETDIRRAGYGGSDYLVGVNGNQTVDINSNNNCIVYYYNHNGTSALESSNKMAFSLLDGSVKFKNGVGKVADVECLNSSNWSTISDPNFIKITTLTFTGTTTSSATTTQRSVTLEVAGELVSDSSYNYSIKTHIKVRNIEFTY